MEGGRRVEAHEDTRVTRCPTPGRDGDGGGGREDVGNEVGREGAWYDADNRGWLGSVVKGRWGRNHLQ